MQCEHLPINGAYLIQCDLFEDERGAFSKIYCLDQFEKHLTPINWVQCNISSNKYAGTLRGMHFQKPPFAEKKLVRCIRGSVFDVILDLRKNSKTFGRWHSEILSADENRTFLIPEGCAHGFQTLVDETEVLYLHSSNYQKDYEGGVIWNDPKLKIRWPLPIYNMSERDKAFPPFEKLEPIEL